MVAYRLFCKRAGKGKGVLPCKHVGQHPHGGSTNANQIAGRIPKPARGRIPNHVRRRRLTRREDFIIACRVLHPWKCKLRFVNGCQRLHREQWRALARLEEVCVFEWPMGGWSVTFLTRRSLGPPRQVDFKAVLALLMTSTDRWHACHGCADGRGACHWATGRGNYEDLNGADGHRLPLHVPGLKP